MFDINEEIPVEVGTGTNNESSLHSILKKWYALPGDRIETRVDGYIADILRDDLVIEIQTANFKALSLKLQDLLKNHKVKVVYPIAEERWIVKLSDKNEVISRRKSPKRGQLIDVFDELIRIPQFINNDNFLFEAVMICVEEIRCDNGKGSWRRKGVSIIDRKLIGVNKRYEFKCPDDFLWFLPEDIGQTFTNKDISCKTGVKINKARKITYCLKKAGILNVCGKIRNEIVYEIAYSNEKVESIGK